MSTSDLLEALSSWVTLVGVIVGFILGEGSQWIRYRLRIRGLRRSLRNECRSLLHQVRDYIDILQKTRDSLSRHSTLPGYHVGPITIIYDSSIAELAPHLSDLERNALHVAYDTVKVTMRVLNTYEDQLHNAITGRYLEDPWGAFQGMMADLIAGCERAAEVLNSYLDGSAIDVLHLGTNERA